MNINEILETKNIIVDFYAEDKFSALIKMIEKLEDNPAVIDIEKVKNAIIEREKIMSTGVGYGFAIPHGKTNGVKGITAVFAKLSSPVEFESIDGLPVDLIFLLVGEEGLVSPHIKLLSKISRLMNKKDFREKLKSATTSSEVYSTFKTEEEKISPQ